MEEQRLEMRHEVELDCLFGQAQLLPKEQVLKSAGASRGCIQQQLRFVCVPSPKDRSASCQL